MKKRSPHGKHISRPNHNYPHWMIGFEPFRRCFDFSGRSRRAEYWYFTLLTLPVHALIETAGMSVSLPTFYFVMILALYITFCYFALLVRRLHDLGRSAYWLTPILPIITFSLIQPIFEEQSIDLFNPESGFISLISFSIVVVGAFWGLLLFVWCIYKGDSGDNHYGNDPLEYINEKRKQSTAQYKFNYRKWLVRKIILFFCLALFLVAYLYAFTQILYGHYADASDEQKIEQIMLEVNDIKQSLPIKFSDTNYLVDVKFSNSNEFIYIYRILDNQILSATEREALQAHLLKSIREGFCANPLYLDINLNIIYRYIGTENNYLDEFTFKLDQDCR